MITTTKLNEIIKFYNETSLDECIKKASKSLVTKYIRIPQISVGISMVLLIGSQIIPLIFKINQSKILSIIQLMLSILFMIAFVLLIKGYEKLPREVYNLKNINEDDSRLHQFNTKLINSKIHLPEINSSIELLDLEFGFTKDKKKSFINAYFFAIILPITFSFFEVSFKMSIIFSIILLSGFIVPLYYMLLKTFITKNRIKMEQIFIYLNRIRIDWIYKEEKHSTKNAST